MTCPGCRRGNDPRRRYCGGCGRNLAPVCQRCDFSNDHDDHFCGGCGVQLLAGADLPATVAAPPRLAVVDGSDAISRADLAELLAPVVPTETVALPQGTINQDDLDRLFGGGS